jgi:hypothetical protein
MVSSFRDMVSSFREMISSFRYRSNAPDANVSVWTVSSLATAERGHVIDRSTSFLHQRSRWHDLAVHEQCKKEQQNVSWSGC